MTKEKKQTQLQRIKLLEAAVINMNNNLKRVHENVNLLYKMLTEEPEDKHEA